jgi:MYXO-CTERM domain-containing protein
MLRNFLTFIATLLCISALSTVASAQVSPPYAEDFESEPTCSTSCTVACVLTTGWLNEPTLDDQDWTVDVGGTTSTNTGPSVDHTLGTSAGKYLYTETTGCTNNSLWLLSPMIDLTAATAPAASFWYHMFGATMGTMHVDVLDNSMAVLALDVIPSFTDNVDLWQESALIDLTPYVGQTIRIRIRGMTGTSFTSDMAIDDFSLFEQTTNDIGVSSIDAPGSVGCGATTEAVTVTIQNFGAAPQSNFDVQYTIDGGAPVVETFTGTIASQATASFTFATLANVATSGPHPLTAATLLVGDEEVLNDGTSSTAVTPTVVNAYPFLDDMESPNTATNWTSGGAQDEWELGLPSTTNLNSTASGANAWATDLDDTYNGNSDNFIENVSCFDFSALTNPAVSLAVNWWSEFSWDGAVLQSSIDGGGSWQNVGAFNDGAANWYNDNSLNGQPGGSMDGWGGQNANSSGGWVTAIHEMAALAGQSDVRFRIAFGADGSVNLEGFAFDDFNIFDNTTNEIFVSNAVAPLAIGGIPLGATDVAVQSLSFTATGAGAQDITALTITKVGTIMDIYLTAKLYLDDGDGTLNVASDTLIDTQMVAAGAATFNTTSMLGIPSLGQAQVFVTYDVDVNAMSGDTFGSSVANAATDIVSAATVTPVDPPFAGPVFSVAGQIDMLPFTDDFTTPPLNLTAQSNAGIAYPIATGPGPMVMMSGTTANDAVLSLVPSFGALLPVEGTNFLLMEFPNSTATGALDYSFDLSAFSAVTDILWLDYRYADNGQESQDEDNIFISVDGGTTWSASLRRFDWTDPLNTWIEETVDVSAALTQAAMDYTNDVVVRFQTSDNTTNDEFMLDRVTLGRAPRASVERIAMMPIAVAGSDMVGTVGAAPQSFMYTITNTGDFPLPIANNSYAFANEMNVSNVVVTGPADSSIAPGASIAFQVDFEPALGAFSFDVNFITTDPYIFNNTYLFSVTGEAAEFAAEIDVQRPAGTSIASGMTDSQGDLTVGEAQTLTYTIENVGFGVDLNVSGVTINNATSATATVTTTPAAVVTPGMTTTFDVEYTADAEGIWSFDIVVASDDADEGSYTIVVDGTATNPMTGTGGGGAGGMPGTGGTGATGGSNGSGGGAAGGEDDGGCGCRTPGGSGSGAPGAIGMWLLGMALVRRRRRS